MIFRKIWFLPSADTIADSDKLPISKGENTEDTQSITFALFKQNVITALTTLINSITQGPQGVQGAPGVQGVAGAKGDKGDKGEQGLQGIKGNIGPQGIPGIPGPTGLKGDKGDVGAQGVQGIKGDTGDTGLKGDTGEGLVTGGLAKYALVKRSNDDYDTEWVDIGLLQNRLISGGETTYDGTTLTVQAAVWEINGIQKEKTTVTEFTGVNLSAADKQRWVLIYGTVNNTILKLEGDEDDIGVAIKPDLPTDTVLVREVLISDDVVEFEEPDLSKLATKDELANSLDFSNVTTGTGTAYLVTPKQKRTTPLLGFEEIRLRAHTPNISENFTLRLRIRNGSTRDYFFPVKDKNGLPIPIGVFKGDMILRYNATTPKSWRVINIDASLYQGGGASEITPLIKTNTDIDTDGYIELIDNAPITDVNIIPYAVKVNGVISQKYQLDQTYSPFRLYGFDKNTDNDIVIYLTKKVSTENPVLKTTALVTILSTDEYVTIPWTSGLSTKHGSEPFDIQLYEVLGDGTMQKSTSLLQVNADKTVYSFYVGTESNLNFYYKII